MNFLNFEEYFLIKESESSDNVIEIDLDDKDSEIKTGKTYSFLGITFSPVITNNTTPYLAIIRREGMTDGKDDYWGKVIRAKTLDDLKAKIRVNVKIYNQEFPEDSDESK